MKLDQLFAKIKPMQKFINTMDLNQQGYYYIEEGSSTVRYVAYEGCPASTIPLNVNMLFSEAWEIKEPEVLCEVPYGVPIEITKSAPAYYVDAGGEDKFLVMNPDDKFDKPLCDMFNTFHSRESAIKHTKMLRDWRKDGLIANAKGEQIDIKVLCPLLKKGKVLFSPNDKKWKWVDNKTIICPENYGWFFQGGKVVTIEGFNLKPADEWENSVMECGL